MGIRAGSGATPLVSVIVPCFDGERFVVEAVESVLAQDHPALEVLVCDDGSSDGSVERLRAFGSRIRVLRQPNRGVSAARNRAAREARGELFAFLDQDDLWEPHMLSTQVERLARRPECGLVYADSWVIDERGDVLGRRGDFLDYRGGWIFEPLLRGNFVPVETLVMRAELFRALGGFRVDLRFLEDYDLCLRAARTHPVAFTAEPLARYRVHDRNLSHAGEGIVREYALLLGELLERDPDLAPEVRRRVARGLRERNAELAWYALRRSDVASADRLLAGGAARCSLGLKAKIRVLRELHRLLPGGAVARLIALLPRRPLYGVPGRLG